MVAQVKLLVETDTTLIEVCETLLQLAKTGELRGLAYTTIRPGSVVGHGWTTSPEVNLHNLVSGVSILSHNVIKAISEEYDDNDGVV